MTAPSPGNGGGARRYYGVYPAIVTDLVDPDRLGRVQVELPWLGGAGDTVRAWATLLTPYADDDQGFLALPEVDTQVVVAFEAGDPHRPYIVGACWNGKEMMPVTPTKPNNRRVLRSREHSVLEFDDTQGSVKVTLATESGHELVLDAGTSEISLTHSGGSKIVISASGQVQITANSTIEMTASALNVHAGSAIFDGTVTCTTLTALTSVVSPSYTPGAGNVW